jgi:hypothetical protein
MKKIPKHYSTLSLNSSPFHKNIHNLLQLGGTLAKVAEGDIVVIAWVMTEWVTGWLVESVNVPGGVSCRIRADGQAGEDSLLENT